ncbi:hypothetical protein [Pectobacterium brasiliense]|uniref:hypothetical protein n=1 Tax=Pectobacterium brasiliense TaxID=180957 RepID=UPI0006913B14|nr:hypothetical protein [Pectobacterium brasiliense]
MTTLTNERLEDIASFAVSSELISMANELLSLRAQLAELEKQEPVAWIVGSEEIDEFKRGREVTVMRDGDEEELKKVPLYSEPTLTSAERERLNTLERVVAGLPQEAIDGGWTAAGISAHAKSLEEKLVAYDRAAKEPVSSEFFDSDTGKWHPFINDEHKQRTIEAGYQVRELYASPPLPVVPDEKRSERFDWSFGEWAEHLGGRHQGGDPANYYEFGSFIAVAEMLKQFGMVQQKAGWNACRAAILQLSGNSEQVSWPQKLPCSVTLNPRLTINKGCPTSTLLLALRRRAEREAELEAMTPDERKSHSDAIEAFKREFLPQANYPVIPEGYKLALSEAVAAIYFNDSTDYLAALFSVVRALSPETMELLLSNEKAAFDATRIAAAPQPSESS